MRCFSFWISGLALVLGCFAAVPASAGGAVVSGKGPEITTRDGRHFAAAGRPVFVAVDELARFGDFELAAAPPLVIRVEGDVEIFQLPDGSLRFVLGREDE